MGLCNSEIGEPKLFYLLRRKDPTGTSGTGIVADGVEFPNGMVALCFRSTRRSVATWESICDMEEVHGHEGNTKIIWRKK